MSGGSRGYISCKIDEELVGRMFDPELDDLMNDVSILAHAVEWYESGDTCKAKYDETVAWFKKKWFQEPRDKRLREYIDREVGKLKDELYTMIGGVA